MTSLTRLALVSVVFLLWFAAIFDPIGNIYGLRYIALGFALPMAFTVGLLRASRAIGLREGMLLASLLLLPIYGLLIYSSRGAGGPFTDTSYIAAGIVLATTWLFLDARLCESGVKVVIFNLRFFAAVIIVTYLVSALSSDSHLLTFFAEGNAALFGVREYGTLTLPYIYFVASPLLVFLIAHETQAIVDEPRVTRGICCIVAILALGLSGTRAHQLIALLYVPVYFLFAKRARVWTIAAGAALLISVLAVGSGLFGSFFDVRETSNSLKLEALDRYGEIFSDPITLVFGQGFNAHEWSGPLRRMIATEQGATKTELTYFELFRVFGVLGAVPYIVLLSVIVYRSAWLPHRYAWLCPGLVLMLMNSALNPYLFSTNGMLPIALALGLMANHRSLRQGAPSSLVDHRGLGSTPH